ncbi:hypothetical protein [Ralstonia phage phiRSL1]|uniref:Uncharacterized protein n=1 Tax=Ralstonia phage phiRSL1 TaxID=1980924 RepID=B2ZY47_9CAUD|nr:hypothetical protein RSL1_ORF193 [Ralstonia phage phiRSL1]BAG41642.1 hypothetical protein [Ralstonia phage phiRSL1]
MTTVVGDCADCIISVPNNSLLSMVYRVSVDEGQNHLIRHRGNVNGYYPAQSVSAQGITLAAGSSHTVNVSTSSILVSTNTPLQMSLVQAGVTVTTMTVRQLMIVDDAFSSFTLTNNGTTDATIFLAYTSGSSTQ